MNEKSIAHTAQKILILVFLASIYLPFMAGFIQEHKDSSRFEKRNLATLPPLPKSMEAFYKYPEALNTYYSDHFGFRDQFTKAYFNLANRVGEQTSVDNVTMGKNEWLFLGSVKPGYQLYDDPMGDVMNVNLFTESELEAFAASMKIYKDYLNRQGIKYLYIIAPNKHTVYFENLPNYISKQNPDSATDQIVAYLRKHTDIEVLDLRSTLIEGKKDRQVYYKSDTHWNQYGANLAQFAILQKIKELLPDSNLSPFLLTDEQFKISTKDNGDLATFAKIERIEDDPQPVFGPGCSPAYVTPEAELLAPHIYACRSQGPNAVVFRDSFFNALIPYVSRQFHRTTYLWEKMNYDSLTKFIAQEHPDIVIEEVVERSLPYIPSNAHLADLQKYSLTRR